MEQWENFVDDKSAAARAAWATIKLSEVGTRPVGLDRVAALAGLPAGETARLVRLAWRDQVDVRAGMIHLDLDSGRPRRYQVEAGGQRIGGGRGCGVDMYLVALALGKPVHVVATCPATGTPITAEITPERVDRVEPPTAVVAIVTDDYDITGGPDHTDAEVCSQQPFFASPEAAAGWVAAHPEGRLVPVRDFHAEARRMVERLESPLG